MGATLIWRDGGLEVRGGDLNAIDADLEAMPDQVPTLAALAPFARGTTHIRNVPNLRVKESDRLAAMTSELRRVGAVVEELPDGLIIPAFGPMPPRPKIPCWSKAGRSPHRHGHGPGRATAAGPFGGRTRRGRQVLPGLLARFRESADRMSSAHDCPRLEHEGLGEIPFGAVLLEETAVTDLSDQQKLAIVLQAAALLSHAALARQVFGEPLATGKSGGPFGSAAVDREGRLRVGPPRPGSFAAPTQHLLAELLRMLFHSHSHGQIAGRGVARRAARQLLSLWSQELVPLAADRAVAQIFAAAPFLWLPAFSVARGTLAAALSRPGTRAFTC